MGKKRPDACRQSADKQGMGKFGRKNFMFSRKSPLPTTKIRVGRVLDCTGPRALRDGRSG